MSVDELWSLHEQADSILSCKILEEKRRLDRRLRQITRPNLPRGHARRPYPPVYPKYRNPNQPSETWAGRGKRPGWLSAQLQSGRRLEDFRIRPF
jgi:DNA-binding protein H-NS